MPGGRRWLPVLCGAGPIPLSTGTRQLGPARWATSPGRRAPHGCNQSGRAREGIRSDVRIGLGKMWV